jgi:prophage antirepressor-like protein
MTGILSRRSQSLIFARRDQADSNRFFMTTDVVVFSFQSKNVRTLTEDGEILFRTSDVAMVLGLPTHKVIDRIPGEDQLLKLTLTEGGQQKVSYLREAGLYRAILRSDKPQAEPFMRWVTNEVLPSIRKQGYYLSERLKEELSEKESELAIKDAELAERDMELARKEQVILQLQGKQKRERRWLVPTYEDQLPGFPSEPRMVFKPQKEIKQPELNIAKYNHLRKTIEGIERQMEMLKREIGMI